MITWKLSYTPPVPESYAVVRTLSEWGITGLKRRRVSQAPDEISFSTAENAVNEPMFAYDGRVKVLAEAGGTTTTWFDGWVGDSSHSINGQQERRSYKAKNAWKWFDQLTFQKPWYRVIDPTSQQESIIGRYRSQMILNMGFNGFHQNIAQQMEELIEFVNQVARQHGIGDVLQLGDCPTTLPPWSDVNDITVGEAVKQQMKWTPDAVTVVDYTTTPPTLHLRQTLPVYSVNFTDEVIGTVSLTPRNDRVVDQVRIKYAQQNNTNGKAWVYDVWDVYPTPPNGTGVFLAESVTAGVNYFMSPSGTIVQSNEIPAYVSSDLVSPENTFGELMVSINLVGWKVNVAQATIQTMAWGSDEWLMQKLPFLRADGAVLISKNFKKLLNQDGSIVTGTPLGYDLITGSLVDGLRLSDGSPLLARQYTAIYELEHSQTIAAKNAKNGADIQTIKFTATNATSGSYSGLQSAITGDPIPIGLAQKLYEGLADLQHDGNVTFKSRELDMSVTWVGRKLSIVGGNPNWVNMRIQTVDETVDDAAVTVSVGVPRYLSAGDMVELLRVTRVRQRFIAPDTVQTGQGSIAANSMPKNTNADNGVGGLGLGTVQNFTSKPPVNGVLPASRMEIGVNAEAGVLNLEKFGGDEQGVKSNSSVLISLADCDGKELKLREATAVNANNDNVTIRLLTSEDNLKFGAGGGSQGAVWL